jgi:hypothetical protein
MVDRGADPAAVAGVVAASVRTLADLFPGRRGSRPASTKRCPGDVFVSESIPLPQLQALSTRARGEVVSDP